MEKFHIRLKECREKKKDKDSKWTQGYIAEKVGVARVTYTAYENGTKQPPLDTINKIADILDVTTDYLLGRSDYSTPPKHVQAGIPDDKYKNLSAYQKEVLDFMLNSDTLAFHDQPKDLLEALESFEVYYEVWKKHQKKEGEQK